MSTKLTALERDRFEEIDAALLEAFRDSINVQLRVGELMHEMLESRLYRDRYPSFDAYCEQRWKITGSMARKWATAANVAKTLQQAADEAPLLYVAFLDDFNPSHAAVLNALPQEQQAEAWTTAKRITPSPTAKVLSQVADKMKADTAKLETMTKTEELTYLQNAESAIDAAVTMARSIEVAERARAGVTKAAREIRSERFAGTFANVIDYVVKIEELLDVHAGKELFAGGDADAKQ